MRLAHLSVGFIVATLALVACGGDAADTKKDADLKSRSRSGGSSSGAEPADLPADQSTSSSGSTGATPSSDGGTAADATVPKEKVWQIRFKTLSTKKNGGNGDSSVSVRPFVPQILPNVNAAPKTWVDNQSEERQVTRDGGTYPLTNVLTLPPLKNGDVIAFMFQIDGTGEGCDMFQKHVFTTGPNGDAFSNTTYAQPVWSINVQCKNGGSITREGIEADVTYEIVAN